MRCVFFPNKVLAKLNADCECNVLIKHRIVGSVVHDMRCTKNNRLKGGSQKFTSSPSRANLHHCGDFNRLPARASVVEATLQ